MKAHVDLRKGEYSMSTLKDQVPAGVITGEKVQEVFAYAKANEFLAMALNIVIKAKNSSLKERTFSYDLNFETPIDEYKYERSRNDDYMRLIPIAKSL